MHGFTEKVIKENERIDDLIRGGLKIIQKPGNFCFSLDSVLLAHFAGFKRNDRVIDLGTGTGVIPLLLTTRGRAKEIYGLEIQEEIADMALRSVKLNKLGDKIKIIKGDLRKAGQIFGNGQFDLVTSNPPYMAAGIGEVNASDSMAIARHEILCTLEDVIRVSGELLNSHGRLAMVHRPNRLADIIYLMRKYALEPKRMQLIYPKMGRKPSILLIEGMKGAKKDMVILEPMFIHQDSGEYTKDVLDLFYSSKGLGEVHAEVERND